MAAPLAGMLVGKQPLIRRWYGPIDVQWRGAIRSYPERIEVLLSEGIDINGHYWPDVGTALHETALNNNLETTVKLLELDADPTIVNRNGERPSDLAPVGSELQELLLTYEALWEEGWIPERHHLFTEQERLERTAFASAFRRDPEDARIQSRPWLPPEIVYNTMRFNRR